MAAVSPGPSHDPISDPLDRLVDRWRGPLVGLLLARGLDREKAHGMAEEVFVEAWMGLRDGRFRGDRSDTVALGAWLRGIARNLAAAHFRRARRGPRLVDQSALLGVAEKTAPVDERALDLRTAIDRLPRTLREVVLVRYLDERSGAETAALLGLSTKAVERRAARARVLLRDMLDGVGQEVQK